MPEIDIQLTFILILAFVILQIIFGLFLSPTIAGILSFLAIVGFLIHRNRQPEWSLRNLSVRRIRLIVEREKIKRELGKERKEHRNSR